jgi:hypothetical protein
MKCPPRPENDYPDLPGQPLTPAQVARGCVHEQRDIVYALPERLSERFGCAWFTECPCTFCIGRRTSN